MPTLQQLPQATNPNPTDQVLLQQPNQTAAVTVANLLATTQPKLTLATGALLGRASILPGMPEHVGLGAGLLMQTGTLAADTRVIASLASPSFTGSPTAPTPTPGDNSAAIATTAFVQTHATPVTAASVSAALGFTPTALPATGSGLIEAGGTLAVALAGLDGSAATVSPAGHPRTLAAIAADAQNLRNLGAAGDGVTDDTAAVGALNSAGGGTVPLGTYKTALDFSTLSGRFSGPGVLVDGGANQRAPSFANILSKPTGAPSETSVSTAFNGDFSRAHIAFEHRIADPVGGHTIGLPAANSYVCNPQTAAIYGYVQNKSGYNGTTSDASSRTGAVAARLKVDQLGQGDLAAWNATATVASTLPGATHFLANPAISLFSGDTSAGISGVLLNPIKVTLSDHGYDAAALGALVNLNRSNGTGALGVTWIGYRAQSVGSTQTDAHFSASGQARIALDLTTATSSAKAALAIKANDRLYLNAANTDTHQYPAQTALGTEWLEYDPTNGAQLVVGGSAVAKFSATGAALAASPATGDNSTSIATTAFVQGQNYARAGNLASVASSGSYTDLTNRPSLGSLAALSSLAGVNASTATTIAAGATASRSLAAIIADRVDVVNFGADPTGVSDSLAAFNAAAAVTTGNVRLFVPRGSYRLSSNFNDFAGRVSVELDDGVVFTNGIPYVGRQETRGGAIRSTNVIGTNSENLYVANSSSQAGNGIFIGYDNYNVTSTNPNGGDVGFSTTMQWHSNATTAGFGQWHKAISPFADLPSVFFGNNWSVVCAEYNPVNNGPDYGWTEIPGSTQTGSAGITMAADPWGATGGVGGHSFYGFGVTNERTNNNRWMTYPAIFTPSTTPATCLPTDQISISYSSVAAPTLVTTVVTLNGGAGTASPTDVVASIVAANVAGGNISAALDSSGRLVIYSTVAGNVGIITLANAHGTPLATLGLAAGITKAPAGPLAVIRSHYNSPALLSTDTIVITTPHTVVSGVTISVSGARLGPDVAAAINGVGIPYLGAWCGPGGDVAIAELTPGTMTLAMEMARL